MDYYQGDRSELENIGRALFAIAEAIRELSGAPAMGPALADMIGTLATSVECSAEIIAEAIDRVADKTP